MLENKEINKNTKSLKLRKKCLLKNIKTELNRLEKAGKEIQFSSERIGKMPTTKPYSNKTKIKSPASRGWKNLLEEKRIRTIFISSF